MVFSPVIELLVEKQEGLVAAHERRDGLRRRPRSRLIEAVRELVERSLTSEGGTWVGVWVFFVERGRSSSGQRRDGLGGCGSFDGASGHRCPLL